MIVFFDIDDTLYNRSHPFVSAAREYFPDVQADLQQIYRFCRIRGDEVFLPMQRGEITGEENAIYRWCHGFGDADIHITPAEALAFQAVYRRKQDDVVLEASAERILRYCAAAANDIGVITNGPSEKQWNKIHCLGLDRFIKKERMIVSGDIGIDKPDAGIFRLAQQRCNAKTEELLYVGDSLNNDVYAAAACGWHTIWVNRDEQPIPDDLPADGVAVTNEELLEVLQRIL